MRFKEGNAVEVLRRNDNDQYGGWFCATILSVNREKCTVRHEHLLAPDGTVAVEVVNEENVRPQPTPDNNDEWIAGNIVEVFDQDSWRAGKIAKVLKNGFVVMKLFGSIQLKEFHSSSLRTQQTWQDNPWIMMDKVQGDQNMNGYTKNPRRADNAMNIALGGGARTVKRTNVDGRDSSHVMATMKRKLKSSSVFSPNDIIEGTSKGRKGSSNGDGSRRMEKYALPKKLKMHEKATLVH